MEINFYLDKIAKIVNWKVKEGNSVHPGNVIFDYVECGEDGEEESQSRLKFKATKTGVIRKVLVSKGSCIKKGTPLLALDPAEQCTHPIVLHDMCGVCSQDLRKLDDPPPNSASVAMVHSVPGLKVSMEEAQILGKLDEQHLIKERKLVLLVDLDQTLIHTTNDSVPHNLEDVFHFQLLSHGSAWYHTRLRPGARDFLQRMSSLFQLHICTFGTRQYANHIAHFLDPRRIYFSDRILSRDECFSQNSKTANLKELFPRGDHMVCIIDDREDVWSFASNLIHVKPYHFFRHTGDINAPPGLTKKDQDDKDGFEFPNENNSKMDLATVAKTSTLIEKAEENDDKLKVDEENLYEKVCTTLPSTLNDKAKEDIDEVIAPVTTTTTIPPPNEMADEEDAEEKDVDKLKNIEGLDAEPTIITTTSSISTKNENAAPTIEGEDKITIVEDCEVKSVTDLPPPSSSEMAEVDVDKQLTQEDDAEKERPITPSPRIEKDEIIKVEDPDDYLLYLEQILRSIHQAYYDLYDDMLRRGETGVPNVKNVIPYVRQKVLKGASIVFSGVIPTQVQLEKSKQYAVAHSLGAHVSSKIIPPPKPHGGTTKSSEPPTTHVVAARVGTAKVNEARRYKGIQIVSPDWLWCCAERWDRVEESLFLLYNKSSFKRVPPAHLCEKPGKAHKEIESVTPIDDSSSDVAQSSNLAGPSTSSSSRRQIPAVRKERTPSGRFMDTINPLLTFSMDEIESMDHEVDDIFNESDSSSSSSEEGDRPPKNERQSPRRKKLKSSSSQVLETRPVVLKFDKDSSSNEEDDTETENENLLHNNTILGKRKRSPVRTETETEDEPISARFRRGEPLPSDLDTLNLLSGGSSDDDDDDDSNKLNDQEDEWMASAIGEFLDDSQDYQR